MNTMEWTHPRHNMQRNTIITSSKKYQQMEPFGNNATKQESHGVVEPEQWILYGSFEGFRSWD